MKHHWVLLLSVAIIGVVLGQLETINSTTTAADANLITTAKALPLMVTNITTESTTTITTRTTTSSSSPSSSSPAAAQETIPAVSSVMTSTEGNKNCSTCASGFNKIYQHQNMTSDSWDTIADCPPEFYRMNKSCVSTVNDNCSDVINLLYTFNSNISFGLACFGSEIRVIKWTDCSSEPAVVKLINDTNTAFCGFRNFSCYFDRNGIRSINKIEVLEPLRKAKGCIAPTTARPTIPLLPNPVGPSAITAIVVLICLFIVAVLAGFFFWPKCHMSKIPPPTPKKKQPPPVEAFNVAYSSSTATGVPNVSIIVPPGQQVARGSAAA